MLKKGRSVEHVDWEAVEREYAKGSRTNVEIAKEFDVSEAVIRKKAKLYNWSKDLTGRIKLKADEAIRKATYVEYAGEMITKDASAIEIEAEIQKQIRLDHRVLIKMHRQMHNKHLKLLEENLDGLSVDKLIIAEKNSVDVAKTLIGLERESFGISDNANGDADSTGKGSIEDFLSVISVT